VLIKGGFVKTLVHQGPNRFAIATILAVGLLAFAWPAEAQIIYKSVNITISDGSYNLDLNNDGVTDFTISASDPTERCGHNQFGEFASIEEMPASGNAAIIGPLTKGELIGPSETYDGSEVQLASLSYCDGQVFGGGNWLKKFSYSRYVGREGYLGLMFQMDGETYYGWAQLVVTVVSIMPEAQLSVTLRGYAYETIPGMSINAGQTK
jgi:hypothetical protein